MRSSGRTRLLAAWWLVAITLGTVPRHLSRVTAIRSIRIEAPDYIFFGDAMWLNCSVPELDYNQIYSIKWFKDNDEMYRFIPVDDSPSTFYQTPGVTIGETRSNYGNLYISRTEFKSQADFRCEVLAENDFTTAIQIKTIPVYYIPRDGQPIILGRKSNFGPNEPVNLTCTAPMSTPAARLAVNLNGNSLTGGPGLQHRTFHNRFENGQTSTSVNVQFPSAWLKPRKLNQFECTASIVHRFNRSASLRLQLRRADNHTAYYLVDDTGAAGAPGDRLAPRIENYRKRYEVGEQLNVRCLSAHYNPMPELSWLLDGRPVDAQYLDYQQSDYHQNGFVRLDLKYRLSYYGPERRHYHQRQQQQWASLGHQRRNGANSNHHNKAAAAVGGQDHQAAAASGTIDSYHFECVQVLSNVISVATEVAQLHGGNNHQNHQDSSGQSLHHGNSVEAVKSFMGNRAEGGPRPPGLLLLAVLASAAGSLPLSGLLFL